MMSRIATKLEGLKVKGQKALIPYIMAGDPDLDTTGRLVIEMERAGADMIELGVPFSDPLADGPTIQRAAIRALQEGVTLKKVFELVRGLRKQTQVPIILMLYYNLIFKYGEEKFVRDAVKAGVDGVITPDLPPDEASVLIGEARNSGLDLIFLLAPTSSPERIRLVAKKGSGFIYYVSLTGVTGARAALDKGIADKVEEIRRASDRPVCVGFGISTPEQAKDVAKLADGVIVGSAIVGVIEKSADAADAVRRVAAFVGDMKKAVSNPGV